MANTNIVISDKCIQCGSCIGFNSKWLEETADGEVKGKNGAYVDASDPEVAKLISVCPVGAISVDTTVKRESREESIKSIISQLENMPGLPKPTRNDMKFNVDDFPISIPYPSGERRYNFSSARSAENAAENEFDRIAYSRIDQFILQIVSGYRVKFMTPYFSKEAEKGSVYAEHNEKISKLLTDAFQLVSNDGDASLPSDFCAFEVYPERDTVWKMLNKGELISDEMIGTIRSEFDSCLSSYVTYFDIDSREKYEGKGVFGGSKYKSSYCYYNVYEACKELIDDVKRACRYKNDALEERAVQFASDLIEEYNKMMSAEIKRKIEIVKNVM